MGEARNAGSAPRQVLDRLASSPAYRCALECEAAANGAAGEQLVRVELVQQYVRRAHAADAPPAGQAPGSGAVRAARHMRRMRRQAARPGFLRAAQAAPVICRGWWQEAVL